MSSQQVAEILVLDDGTIEGDDEDAVAEARHIAEDLAKVGQTQHSCLWALPGGRCWPGMGTLQCCSIETV